MKKIAFTIVLNGMPFIKTQANILPTIFDEWHIIEGATLPNADTAWCKNINEEFYSDKKLSVDGTTEFIDSIVDNKQIFVHRKNDFWNGKVEMCNSFMSNVKNSILMEFDVDEIWNQDVLADVLLFAETNDHFDGMLFKCNYYVGPNLIIKNENCYGNRNNEWMRLWKVTSPTHWISHEPPRLKGCTRFLSKTFTQSKRWTFDHYAYVMEDQVKFKENFYGYKDAYKSWKALQLNAEFPCMLKNYLKWVSDDALVDIKRY